MKPMESAAFWGNMLGSGVQTGLGMYNQRKQADEQKQLLDAYMQNQAQLQALREKMFQFQAMREGFDPQSMKPIGSQTRELRDPTNTPNYARGGATSELQGLDKFEEIDPNGQFGKPPRFNPFGAR